MLEKLGFKKKTHVGISVSANNLIELVCVDKAAKSITKYSSSNIKYNNAIKEIIDFNEFEEAIQSLFEDAELNPAECSVTLSLPNVQFGIMPIDSSSGVSYYLENILTELEDVYIFKKNEPVVSYIPVDNEKNSGQKNIIYSAIQSKVVSKIIDIFDNLGIELVRIDVSYNSMLKALQYSDTYKRYFEKEEKTAILLVTANNCVFFFLNGSTITDYTEEPLAVRSFSQEEVFSIISKIAEDAILKNNPQSLLIISETEEFNAETITKAINFDGDIEYINKDANSNGQILDVETIDSDNNVDMSIMSYISIEAIGSAVSAFDEYPLNINFLPEERISQNIVEVNGYEIDFYRFLIITFGLAIFAALIISLIYCGILSVQTNSLQESNTEMSNEIQVFKKKTQEKKPTKNLLPVFTQILETNKSVVDLYVALSTDIPESIYIKKFVTNSAGGIGILGESQTSESVQNFVKDLREQNGDLMLSKLSLNTKDDPTPFVIKDGFTFEIKTANTEVSLSDDILTSLKNEINLSGKNNTNSYNPIMTPPPSPVI